MCIYLNFNTSYVKVHPQSQVVPGLMKMNFNTSYVKVHHKMLTKEQIKKIFQYILC